jgi:outer membrane receptor protein involved in Fe transport
MTKSRKKASLGCLLLALALAAPMGRAQEATTPADSRHTAPRAAALAGDDLGAMDLGSLLNVQLTTPSKFAEKLKDAPGIVSVVTRDELQRFSGLTLREILERVAGLYGSTTYFSDRSLVAARGDQIKDNSSHVLYLINGRPTRDVVDGGMNSDLLESFPVGILERVEVVKGPGSVLYGSNAFSAVINLITQKADQNGVALSGFGGEGGAYGTAGQVTYKRGDFSLVGAAQFHEKPDWPISWRYENPLTSVVTTVHGDIPDGGPGAFLAVDYKGLSLTTSLTSWNSGYFLRGFYGEHRWTRSFSDLGYQTKIKPGWDMSVNLTYTRVELSASAYPFAQRSSNDAVVEWTNTMTLTKTSRLIFGSLYNYIDGTEYFDGVTPRTVDSHGTRSAGAAYAQMDYRPLGKLKLVGGFQVNKVGTLKAAFVPRAGVLWDPASRLNVKALYSQAFRAPSINETTLDHPALRGNPDLKPETVDTVDLGVTYQGGRAQLALDYFHSVMKDIISLPGSAPPRTYENLGTVYIHGVEVEGKCYLTKSLFVLGSMLYQENKDAAGAQDVSAVPNFGIKGGLSYKGKNLTLSLFDYYEGRVAGYDHPLNPGPRAQHLLSLHGRLDLARYLNPHARHGLALFVHGTDLLNEQLWFPDWGQVAGDTTPAIRGRLIYAGLEIGSK